MRSARPERVPVRLVLPCLAMKLSIPEPATAKLATETAPDPETPVAVVVPVPEQANGCAAALPDPVKVSAPTAEQA